MDKIDYGGLMRIGFYYHICLSNSSEGLRLPSYLGVFVDALAKQCYELVIYLHEANAAEAAECDYTLTQKNIQWVNLGLKTPAWHRAIFYKRILKRKLQLYKLDYLIVRAPSPLAPYFYKYITQDTILWFMVVGHYIEGGGHLKKAGLRDRLIYYYLKYNDNLFTKAIRSTNIMVNSPSLYELYKPIAKSIHQIRTTTLSELDFYEKEDTCQSSMVHLLFTGRIEISKGVFELLDATAQLIREGILLHLHIVGWEQQNAQKVQDELRNLAHKNSIQDSVTFHGRKSVGPSLNAMYRMADLYVLPSYHEGFPRTIWEAMANSLPVICTEVGGIPQTLHKNEDCLMIEPQSVNAIKEAIKELIANAPLRKKLIKNGRELAKANTLEAQTRKIIDILTSSKVSTKIT